MPFTLLATYHTCAPVRHARPLNREYAVALHVAAHNFVRVHGSLRCSPAMAADVTDKLWDIGDVVTMAENQEDSPDCVPDIAM